MGGTITAEAKFGDGPGDTIALKITPSVSVDLATLLDAASPAKSIGVKGQSYEERVADLQARAAAANTESNTVYDESVRERERVRF